MYQFADDTSPRLQKGDVCAAWGSTAEGDDVRIVDDLKGFWLIINRYPDPSELLIWTVNSLLLVRKLFVRHLFWPRPNFLRKKYIPTGPDLDTGRYNALEYLSFPWYVEPTFARRWGPRSWLTRLVGRKLPGDDGNTYAPEGWTHLDLGPDRLKGKGCKYMAQEEERLVALGRGGCPFARKIA